MLKHGMWHMELYFIMKTMENCFNDKTNLYVYKFDYEMSTIANETTKFPEQ